MPTDSRILVLILIVLAIGSLLVAQVSILVCSQILQSRIPDRWNAAMARQHSFFYAMRRAVQELLAEGVIQELQDPQLAKWGKRITTMSKACLSFGAMAAAVHFTAEYLLR